MNLIQSLVLVLHVLAALSVCGFVLLQHGKGADMGAAFGSGSAGSLFGSAGAANFLSRTTAILAAVFFLTSLGLTYFSAPSKSSGVIEQMQIPGTPQKAVPAQQPAAPAPSAPAPAAPPAESGKSSEIPK